MAHGRSWLATRLQSFPRPRVVSMWEHNAIHTNDQPVLYLELELRGNGNCHRWLHIRSTFCPHTTEVYSAFWTSGISTCPWSLTSEQSMTCVHMIYPTYALSTENKPKQLLQIELQSTKRSSASNDMLTLWCRFASSRNSGLVGSQYPCYLTMNFTCTVWPGASIHRVQRFEIRQSDTGICCYTSSRGEKWRRTSVSMFSLWHMIAALAERRPCLLVEPDPITRGL